MTNRECLHRLTDEEFARLFIGKCRMCSYNKDYNKCRDNGCRKGIAEWLKIERSEENDKL